MFCIILDEILNELKKNNIVKPSAVQSVTWPATLSGRNVIGIAQTGSGKTLSVSIFCVWPFS